jgi:glycosyltransferase involved in cell wall biosynthesis
VRLLIISDLAATGFGRVGRELATRLVGLGWDTKIIAINWRGIDGELMSAAGTGTMAEQGARLEERLATLRADPLIDLIIPANVAGDPMGNNLTAPALRGTLWQGWVPEAVIIVADPRAIWTRLARDMGSLKEAADAGIPILNYVPVEGSGLPRDWAMIWNHTIPVAMSEFGRVQLETLLGRPVPMIYHGVAETFRPITPLDPGSWHGATVQTKDGAKRAIGAEGRTVILRADRFIFRKNYPAWFRILRPILAARPKALAIAHTVPTDDMGQGTLWQLISREDGATPHGMNSTGELVWEHPQYRITGWHDSFRGLDDEDLRTLYNAADLVVSPTMAEGFGLTLAEAEACGVPVIATDYSAVSEVVGPGGVLIKPNQLITNAYAHEWALVDEAEMTRQVERIIDRPARLRALGEAGRAHVKQFSWADAAASFDQLMRAAIAAHTAAVAA